MERHYQVIFEALLSVLIIIELFLMILISVGFVAGITHTSVFNFGIGDLTISIIILVDFVLFRFRVRANHNTWNLILENWHYFIASIPLFFISFNLYYVFYKICK